MSKTKKLRELLWPRVQYLPGQWCRGDRPFPRAPWNKATWNLNLTWRFNVYKKTGARSTQEMIRRVLELNIEEWKKPLPIKRGV